MNWLTTAHEAFIYFFELSTDLWSSYSNWVSLKVIKVLWLAIIFFTAYRVFDPSIWNTLMELKRYRHRISKHTHYTLH